MIRIKKFIIWTLAVVFLFNCLIISSTSVTKAATSTTNTTNSNTSGAATTDAKKYSPGLSVTASTAQMAGGSVASESYGESTISTPALKLDWTPPTGIGNTSGYQWDVNVYKVNADGTQGDHVVNSDHLPYATKTTTYGSTNSMGSTALEWGTKYKVIMQLNDATGKPLSTTTWNGSTLAENSDQNVKTLAGGTQINGKGEVTTPDNASGDSDCATKYCKQGYFWWVNPANLISDAICQMQCTLIDFFASIIAYVVNSVLYPSLGL